MIKATHNKYIDININLSDDITVPIVKLGNDLEIPTIPFIWHREESLNIPIHAIIKISNESMKNIIQNHCNYTNTDSIKKLLMNNVHESYIVNQRTILEKVNYYISYHGISYRENIASDVACEQIPNDYNKSVNFKSVIYPLIKHDTIFSPNAKSLLYKISTGGAHIHNRAFSPPGCFHFKINESSSDYVFLVHGINSNTQPQKTVTVLFILINDHYTPDDKCIQDDKNNNNKNNILQINQNESMNQFTKKIVKNIIDTSVNNVVQKLTKKSINEKFITILENNFSKELNDEIIIIKNLDVK